MDEEGDEDYERHLDIANAKGNLHSWIKAKRTVRWIRNKFRKFILSFKGDKNEFIYSEALKEMCDNNK